MGRRVTLTVDVVGSGRDHVLAALHREVRFMQDVGLVEAYAIETGDVDEP